ncbi:MAG: SGNH/GDSL hydrolase family protein [Coriobacteriales bacterium]
MSAERIAGDMGNCHVLMLGNSFTSANDMPSLLAEATGVAVVAHVRGGARLAEHLNPATSNGKKTGALLERRWPDIVVMQEMSTGPITSPLRFSESVGQLCEACRSAGAAPVLFATWAFRDDCPRLEKLGLSRAEMHAALHEAYAAAARENGAVLADVGTAFFQAQEPDLLYRADGMHPSRLGTELCVQTISDALETVHLTRCVRE